MVTLYKDGAECTADPEQVEIMEEGGWSREPKKAEPKEEKKEAAKPAGNKTSG